MHVNRNLMGECVACQVCGHLILHTNIFHHLYEEDVARCNCLCEQVNKHECESNRIQVFG